MKLHCYQIPPIDFWFGALTSENMLATASEEILAEGLLGTDGDDWAALAAFCRSLGELQDAARAAFKTIGWEGDVTQGPFYFVLPDEDYRTSVGYMLKQSNNGTCFIASPHALPHLDSLAFNKTVTG